MTNIRFLVSCESMGEYGSTFNKWMNLVSADLSVRNQEFQNDHIV